MPYTFEFEDGTVRAWHLTEAGAEPELVEGYAPSLFVDAPAAALAALRERLEADPKVRATGFEQRYTSLHERHDDDPTQVLRVDLERVGEVRTLAREIRGVHARGSRGGGGSGGRDADADLACAPGTVRLFDVDLAPGFRYCLDEGVEPTTSRTLERDLRTLRIGIDERALAAGDVTILRVDGERVRGDPRDVCWSLGRRLERTDPDVLVVSHADLVPLLHREATDAGLDGFHLGRLPGWTRLAGENTFQSYGQVGHSPARYRVPGRAIVDESNSFLWRQSGLPGLEYMVRRTGRPLQEAARGSIGTLLTSMQIRMARAENVLAPLNKWEPERFKDVGTLHAADRGGHTVAPEVGFHEDVHEIDFASLYPRIICRHNVSPETVDCGCEPPDSGADAGEHVPELGYRICERSGFLPEVLDPLLRDRAKFKRALSRAPEGADSADSRAKSGAIKWVLVSCFGYQGYRNAKFGRIECHEAINAYARDILLDSKARLEAAGWRVVHGIVDSLWVTPDGADPEPLEDVVDAIEAAVGIPLERDGRYEWVCFVPRRDAIRTRSESSRRSGESAGALTKYFGKRENGAYTFRGIEARQRSTPAFVADCQREFVEALDRERDPTAVCDRLERRIGDLRRGAVDPADLVITKRASRSLEAYRSETRTVAALRRYEAHGVTRHPGQSVRYVVWNDDARRTRERVRLEFECAVRGECAVRSDRREREPREGGRRSREHSEREPREGERRSRERADRRSAERANDERREQRAERGSDEPPYDVDFYADLLVRACESVLSPLGWDRTAIQRHLADGRTVGLSAFLE